MLATVFEIVARNFQLFSYISSNDAKIYLHENWGAYMQNINFRFISNPKLIGYFFRGKNHYKY